MASTYGSSFGFRRSDEHMRSGTEGRHYVPDTGTFRQGDLVMIDTANPGKVKLAPADTPIDPGFVGLIIQESSHFASAWAGYDANRDERVKNGESCAIWTGAGLKIWVKNREARVAASGRPAVDAREIVGALTVGDYVKWDGAKYVAGTAANAVGRCTLAADGYAEIVLAK